MSIESDIYSALSGHAGLAALVADRIYPSAIAQGTSLPAVAFARVETEYINTLAPATALSRSRIAVQAWGPGQADVESVGDAIEAAMLAVNVPPEARYATFDAEMGLYGLTVEFDWWT
jgi:hypothetical protein